MKKFRGIFVKLLGARGPSPRPRGLSAHGFIKPESSTLRSMARIKSIEGVYRLLISVVGMSFDGPAWSSPLAGIGGTEHRGRGTAAGGEGSKLGLRCAQLQFDPSYTV
jgi:hypothetical protein